MQLGPTERGVVGAKAALLVGLPVVAGIVLGANQTRAGAYMPWGLSIVYWTSISCATWWLFALATHLTKALLRPWRVHEALCWVMGGVAGSFAARPAIYAIADSFRPVMASPNLRPMVPARLEAQFFAYYLTNWSVLLGLWVLACWWLQRSATVTSLAPSSALDSHHVPNAAPARPALHGIVLRLPPALGRDIVALQAEDHYVRVHTRLGNALVLATLSDAIEDVTASGIDGQRTHRSWWVARDAVVSSEQRGRQLALVLTDGSQAPVSVTYRQLAAASGLLAAKDS